MMFLTGSGPGRITFRCFLCRVLVSSTILIPSAGCSIADLNTEVRRQRGLVIVLPGIEGKSVWNLNIARGLDDGGVDHGIEIFEWGTQVPFGMLINLTDQGRNYRVAKELSERILEYQGRYPGRPVHLVGHSGGAGIAIMAVEQLPKDARIAGMVLLAAAVSPKHDLRGALERVDYGIYSYFSDRDIGLLKVGTTLFGTMDRRYEASAGAVGFVHPQFLRDSDHSLYEKLHQIRWRPAMRAYGNAGGHAGWTRRRFVRKCLATVIIDTSSRRTAFDWNDRPFPGFGAFRDRDAVSVADDASARLPDREWPELSD
ncbi:MAG: hypothetical protein O7F76_07030 [Planctomycetota bacterium]|nr:hypothetical protein [Planctomycetota bacterium]